MDSLIQGQLENMIHICTRGIRAEMESFDRMTEGLAKVIVFCSLLVGSPFRSRMPLS